MEATTTWQPLRRVQSRLSIISRLGLPQLLNRHFKTTHAKVRLGIKMAMLFMFVAQALITRTGLQPFRQHRPHNPGARQWYHGCHANGTTLVTILRHRKA